MKKTIILLILICLVGILCACGDNKTSNNNGTNQENPAKTSQNDMNAKNGYSIDDLLGKWVSFDTKKIMIIKADGTELYSVDGTISSNKNYNMAKVEGTQVDLSSFSTYTISKKENGNLTLICNETNTVEKGTVFEKVEDIYTKDVFFVDWVNEATGDTMSYSNGYFNVEYKAGGSNTFSAESIMTAGDHLYISSLGEFIVVEENGTMRLNGGNAVYTRKADIERAIQLNRESHADVYNAIAQKIWLFNGGGDTVLNYIKFSEQKAEMGQTYVDGNGIHDNGVNESDYSIEDSAIIVKTADGAELPISYTMSDGVITLGEGAYLSIDQVEESLQGYWKCRYSSDVKGIRGTHESNLFIDHGIIKSERASTVFNGEPGEYYYYGPYEGTYTLGIGKFETDMYKGNNWFYNIINGVPTVFEYDNMCVKSDGFPGENGYYFD